MIKLNKESNQIRLNPTHENPKQNCNKYLNCHHWFMCEKNSKYFGKNNAIHDEEKIAPKPTLTNQFFSK